MTAVNVLVIDDDQDVADSLADFLMLDGHRVDVQYSGSAGVRAALAGEYDQILIDVGLPDVRGSECARQIRQAKPSARILLVTGHSASAIEPLDFARGDIEILTKPIDLDALTARLAAISGDSE